MELYIQGKVNAVYKQERSDKQCDYSVELTLIFEDNKKNFRLCAGKKEKVEFLINKETFNNLKKVLAGNDQTIEGELRIKDPSGNNL